MFFQQLDLFFGLLFTLLLPYFYGYEEWMEVVLSTHFLIE